MRIIQSGEQWQAGYTAEVEKGKTYLMNLDGKVSSKKGNWNIAKIRGITLKWISLLVKKVGKNRILLICLRILSN